MRTLFRLISSSRITEASDHIYARVQPKDKRISTTSSASMASASATSASTSATTAALVPSTSQHQPPNLLDLIPPPPTYPPSEPRTPLIRQSHRGGAVAIAKKSSVASEATEETSRLLMTEECDGSLENGYAKLKWNKNKVRALEKCANFFWRCCSSH